MRPIEINLATRPFRNNTLYWAGFGSAAGVLAALSVLNVWLFFGYGSTVRRHQEDFGQKQQRREVLAKDEQRLSLKLTKLDFKSLSQQSDFANGAIRQRIFSWTELFNRLEEVVPPTVMMTSIRPEIQAEGISIMADGSAKDQEALLQFEENLIRNSHFSRIFPGSERREQRGQDLRFSLKFEYIPQGRPATSPPAPEGEKASAAPAPAPPAGPAPPGPAPTAGGGKEQTAAAAAAPAKPGSGAAGQKPLQAGIPPGPAPPPKGPAGTAPAAAAAKAPSSSPPGGQGAPAPAAPGPATASRPGVPGGPAPVGGPSGRPLLKVGVPQPGGGPINPNGYQARREAEAAAAARFVDRPLQDVFDYLMKSRSMTFVFAGDFDLRQKVTMDLNNRPEEAILDILASTLDCTVAREGPHAFRLSPKSGGEPLEDRPVEEESAPPSDGGSDDSGQEPPP